MFPIYEYPSESSPPTISYIQFLLIQRLPISSHPNAIQAISNCSKLGTKPIPKNVPRGDKMLKQIALEILKRQG